MNEIEIFNNAEFGQVRTFTDNDGKTLFCGADVAKALGYSNSRKALADHCKEKGVTKCDTLTNGGTQALTYIDEGNVYRLISHSKLPSAERFESWVFDEVLPSIRKHGVYATEQVVDMATNNPDFMIQIFTKLKKEKEEKERLKRRVDVQQAQIEEMKPQSEYCKQILDCDDLLCTTIIAKDYGMSARQLNDFLAEKRIQFKQGKTWILYQQYADCGYTGTKTYKYDENHSSVTTYWTQKGRMFIYETLKANGILPLVERQRIA